jgi:hypothetical protein
MSDMAKAKRVKREDIFAAAREVSHWGRWGKENQKGTLNNVSPESIIEAGWLIRDGEVFSLALSLKEPIRSGPSKTDWTAYAGSPAPGMAFVRVFLHGPAAPSVRWCGLSNKSSGDQIGSLRRGYA